MGVLVRVHPSRVDVEAMNGLARVWLRSNYWRTFGITEWAYRDIPPQLLIEELLDDGGDSPADYRFWCFNGTVGFIMVDAPRLSDNWRSLHRPDWSVIDADIHYPRPRVAPSQPEQLGEMLAVAEALSDGLDFLRVDLFAVEERIIVGELTHYPAGGTQKMWPEDVLTELGANWQPWTVARGVTAPSFGAGRRRKF
jgi:hypothetical protein